MVAGGPFVPQNTATELSSAENVFPNEKGLVKLKHKKPSLKHPPPPHPTPLPARLSQQLNTPSLETSRKEKNERVSKKDIYNHMLSRLTTASNAGRYAISAARRSANALTVEWEDGVSASYPFKWMVDHAPASPFINVATLQRGVDTFEIPFNIQPHSIQITNERQQISVDWNAAAFTPAAAASGQDHAESSSSSSSSARSSSSRSRSRVHYCSDWLRRRRLPQSQGTNDSGSNADTSAAAFTTPEVWRADLFVRNGGAGAPTVPFEEVVSPDNDNEGLQRLLAHLVKYGLACVSGTPGTMAETERLARRIGFVEETLYGKMWATAPDLTPRDPTQAYSGDSPTVQLRQGNAAALQQQQQQRGEGAGSDGSVESYSDTAYSNVELHLHTDGCYYTNPPGLQIFNCAYNTAAGGASRYVDGFAVAAQLQHEDPDAFAFLAEAALPYHCFDSAVHQLAWGPIFDFKRRGMRLKRSTTTTTTTTSSNQLALQLSSIRHNDYDRAALCVGMSSSEVEQFYAHHTTLTALLRDPSNVLLLPQHEGNTMICNNHRVLHGRDAFEGARNLMGCYIGKDEWTSKARLLGVLQADAL